MAWEEDSGSFLEGIELIDDYVGAEEDTVGTCPARAGAEEEVGVAGLERDKKGYHELGIIGIFCSLEIL